jgi:hypothetical protein
MKGAVMVQSRLTPAGERIIEPMIELARCSKLKRIIVAGAKSAALMFELHRRGYVHVATTANCGLPAGQYDVALVDWRERSIKGLDTTLDWLVDFLGSRGVLVVWTDPQEPAGNRSSAPCWKNTAWWSRRARCVNKAPPFRQNASK